MSRIDIVEVGPRDGLQNESVVFDTATKVDFINRCLATGTRRIEVASFVNPKRVPQMADGEAVLERLTPDAASYIGLVLNERGFDRALATQVSEVNLVVMVTDTFSLKNQGMTTDEAIAAVQAIAPRSREAGLPVSVTLSASFGCPYEGEVDVARLVDVAAAVSDGIDELAIADTIGVAVPSDVHTRVAAVREVTDARLRVHVHNTRNTGYASALAAADAGVAVLDASLGGIGGCPFAPQATGNIATEDLVFALERSGYDTGLDLDALCRASEWLGEQLGRPTPGLVAKAGPFPPV
jgi:hydroxymethylglutaryl-CoA lyase